MQQESKFTEQKVELGKAKGYKVSIKAKFIPQEYNVFCCGWQKLTPDGCCPICHRKIIKERIYKAEAQRFNTIYEQNKHIMESHAFTEFERESIQIPVQIGHAHYFVPLRYFIEFANIPDHASYDKFFGHIKQQCHSAKL